MKRKSHQRKIKCLFGYKKHLFENKRTTPICRYKKSTNTHNQKVNSFQLQNRNQTAENK
jgi:hypothetical protein